MRISLPQNSSGGYCERGGPSILAETRANVKEGADLSDFQPDWDPFLRGDSRIYKKFIKMLHKAGYLTHTQQPKGFCGVFFDKKSDGQNKRMIIDARGTNRLLKEPPGVDLLTADGFARVETAPRHKQFLSNMKISVGLSDVKDCFHRLRQPRWLSEYFCLDVIPANWVNLQNTMLDAGWKAVGPEDAWDSLGPSTSHREPVRTPCRASIPWHHPALVRDGSEAIVFGATQKDSKREASHPVHHYGYVDNLVGQLGMDHDAVERSLHEVEEVFTSHNLILHPGLLSSGATKALGCERFDGV